MKKIICVLLSLLLAATLCACGSSNTDSDSNNSEAKTEANTEAKGTTDMQTVLDPAEYVLYQNIFYNDMGSDYDGKNVVKEGTFTTLIDKYNNKTRYYVWGYNDQTKCCDYQWEINITDAENIPSNGSLVEVSGTFASSSDSLDGYWIENSEISVKSEYQGSDCDIDMTAMDGTLERVQLINMQNHANEFENKTVRIYGRVESADSVQHPYYDGAFSQKIESNDAMPAIGTVVIVEGIYSNGIITNATVKESNRF